jgi:hypothetical protein
MSSFTSNKKGVTLDYLESLGNYAQLSSINEMFYIKYIFSLMCDFFKHYEGEHFSKMSHYHKGH